MRDFMMSISKSYYVIYVLIFTYLYLYIYIYVYILPFETNRELTPFERTRMHRFLNLNVTIWLRIKNFSLILFV